MGCLISLFYIKPQLIVDSAYFYFVVLYLCSTSNHNSVYEQRILTRLSYISVLHQTTTIRDFTSTGEQLSYISVLHQTTTG